MKRSDIIEKNTSNPPNTTVKTYENEDITTIAKFNDQTELKLYYTIFNTNSVSFEKRLSTWFNISQYLPTTCGTEELNIRFNNAIVGDSNNGIICNGITAKGPLSSNIGTGDITETLTIFTTIKFVLPESTNNSESSRAIREQNNIIKIYANSANNNGVAMSLKNISDLTTNNAFTATLEVLIGADTTCSITDFDFKNNKSYLFVITKNVNNISLSIVSEIDSSDYTDNITQENIVDANSQSLHLSNKSIELNSFHGRIYNLGIYNNKLVSADLSKIINHINRQFLKSNKLLKEKDNLIAEKENEIATLKGCKYDTETCDKCPSVTDWSNQQQILNASIECKRAINEYCSKAENYDNELCACWNPSISETPACINYRNIFTDTVPSTNTCDIDALLSDKSSILHTKIKESNICKSKPVKNTDNLQLPAVRMINNAFDLNKSDIEIYDDIVI